MRNILARLLAAVLLLAAGFGIHGLIDRLPGADRGNAPNPAAGLELKINEQALSVGAVQSVPARWIRVSGTLTEANPASAEARLLVDGAVRFKQPVGRNGEFTFDAFYAPLDFAQVSIEITFGLFSLRSNLRRDLYVMLGDDKELAPIAVDPLVPLTAAQVLPVTGKGGPNQRIEIVVNDSIVATATTDALGNFATVVPLSVGDNAMTVRYSFHRGAGAETKVGGISRVLAPNLQERTVTLTESFPRWTIELLVTLDATDPMTELIFGPHPSPKAFFQAAAGRLLINSIPLDIFLNRAVTNARVEKGRAIVELTFSDFPPPTQLTPIKVQRFGGAAVAPDKDTLVIKLDTSRAMGFSQRPNSSTNKRFEWTGAAASSEIAVHVEKDWRRFDAMDVLPRDWLGPFYSFLLIIPILWLFALLRGPASALWPAPIESRLRWSAMLIGAIAFVTTFSVQFPAVRPAQPDEHVRIAAEYLMSAANVLLGLDLPLQAARIAVWLAVFGGLLLLAGLLPRRPWSEWVRDVLGMLALSCVITLFVTLAFARRYPPIFTAQMVFIITSAISVAVLAAVLVYLKSSLEVFLWRRVRLSLWVMILVAVVGVAGAWPWSPLVVNRATPLTFSPTFAIFSLLSYLRTLSPLILAALVVAVCLGRRETTLDTREVRYVAPFLFAGTLVSPSVLWAVIPVQVLVGYLVARFLLFQNGQRLAMFWRLRDDVVENRPLLLQRAIDYDGDHRQALAHRESARTGAKKEENSHAELFVTTDQGERLRATELALAYGVRATPAEDAREALRIGGWMACLLVAFYVLPIWFSQPLAAHTNPVSEMVRPMLIAGYWLLAAFFFGYFYTAIRGRSGWSKGIWMAFGLSLAEAPLTLLGANGLEDIAALLLAVTQRFAFFIVVGYLAFDHRVFKASLGRSIDWRAFSRASGLSVTGAFSSTIITAIGVALSSAVSGQLTSVMALAAKILFPVLSATAGTPQTDLRGGTPTEKGSSLGGRSTN